MNYLEQRSYVKKHGILLPNDQVFLEKPLFVFKKVFTYVKADQASILADLAGGNALGYNTDSPYYSLAYRDNKVVKATRYLSRYTGVDAIANLIIPAGSIVNLPQSSQLKMRANQAIVYSITRKHDKAQVAVAVSKWDSKYTYVSAKYFDDKKLIKSSDLASDYDSSNRPSWMNKFSILPEYPFNTDINDCESGIHFFLEVSTAIQY